MTSSTKLSSVHVLATHKLGGAGTFFIRLVEALAQRGHPTLAVVTRGGRVAERLSPQVEQVQLPMRSKWDLASRLGITWLIARRRPDVVQTYMRLSTRLTRLPPFSRAAHVARVGSYEPVKRYYHDADACIGITEGICRYVAGHGVPAERILHIGNFVPELRRVEVQEVQALRARLALPPDAFVLLAMGRLVALKGFSDLLEALAANPAVMCGRPVVLLIAGDGEERENLKAQAARLGLGDQRLRWLGLQTDVAPWYALADAFVFPSRLEALGNVLLEAWQCRLPVLCTDHEGAQELVEAGRNGLMAPRSNPPALAKALRELIEMPEPQRRRLADAGFETVRQHHRESVVLDAYLGLYERLRDTRRPR